MHKCSDGIIVLGELEGDAGLVEEVGNFLILTAEESPTRQLFASWLYL